MSLPEKWATPEDFATLFQYVWHRDFPMGPGAVGAKRVDWTIHIGIAVRTIADLMGLVTRFESGGRKDAILRSPYWDEIAVEWEWEGVGEGVEGDELSKLKKHDVWVSRSVKVANPQRLLKYGVLITYVRSQNIELRCNQVSGRWRDARWPLLLILVDIGKNEKFGSGREFRKLNMFVFNCQGEMQTLRKAPAYPWEVEGSRWAAQTV
jgi:hypothetical protein